MDTLFVGCHLFTVAALMIKSLIATRANQGIISILASAKLTFLHIEIFDIN